MYTEALHLLLKDERLVIARLSSASAIALPTTSLLGRLRAEMASCNSVLSKASFFAFSSSGLRLTVAASDGRDTLSLDVAESALGMLIIDNGSLVSRFNMGVEADLINAITPLGPRDILRRFRSVSLERTLSSVLDGLDAGRLVTEPGFDFDFVVVTGFSGFFILGFCGGIITGPPSWRLIESHFSGNLAEKLCKMLVVDSDA